MSNVVHPKHYNLHPSGVEAIDLCEHLGFNVGNAIKYLFRADHKGHRGEDLDKARFYLNRARDMMIPLNANLQVISPIRDLIRDVHAASPDSVLGKVLGAWLVVYDRDECQADTG